MLLRKPLNGQYSFLENLKKIYKPTSCVLDNLLLISIQLDEAMIGTVRAPAQP